MSQIASDSPQIRPKKIMTAEMLKNLELAREKARIKRKEMGELSQLKKQLAKKTTAQEIEEIKAKLDAPAPEPEIEPEEPPEIQPVKKVKKHAKKPIVIVEQSESESEDEQVVYIRRKSSKPRRVLEEEPLIPDEPRYSPAPAPQVPQSPYQGFHPSMLSRRRF